MKQKDPVVWLEQNLVVGTPKHETFLEISLKGDDPEELVLLVDAITRAYVEDASYQEEKERHGQICQFEKHL